MSSTFKHSLVVLLASLSAGQTIAKTYGAADFARHVQYLNAQISPDGRYLAVALHDPKADPELNKYSMAVIELAGRKIISNTRFAETESVSSFFWDNEERLILRTTVRDPGEEVPKLTNNIYATNADGSSRLTIFGENVIPAISSPGKKREQDIISFPKIISRLSSDNKHILVASYSSEKPKIFRLNTYTAIKYDTISGPEVGEDIVLDQNHIPRFAGGSKNHDDVRLYEKSIDSNSWSSIYNVNYRQVSWHPLAIEPDNSTVLILSEENNPIGEIYAWNRKSDTKQLIATHPITTPQAIFADDGVTVIGFVSEVGYPEYQILRPEHPEGALLKQLVYAFPKQKVNIINYTEDHKTALVLVSDSTNPGDWFLIDTKTKKATYLLSVAAWLDPNEMAIKEPIEFSARDGLKLHGYITYPQGKAKKYLPLVQLVHGGPYGVRDESNFDAEVQFLASRGYAVMQINFRGSGGFGSKFMYSAYRKRGKEMQDDLSDAVSWAIKEGIADANRVCIMGASYGGYAAAMGISKEPDLYKCAVAGAGVYDIQVQLSKSDTQTTVSGVNFLKAAWGDDVQELRSISPVYLTDKVKAPIFLWHGAEDDRVPPKNFYDYVDALKKSGKEVEVMMKSREGHGYVNESNRTELYEKIEAFLDKHIGH